MNNTNSAAKTVAIAAGTIYGLFLFVFSLALGGAGHGWGGAVPGGFVAIFTSPNIANTFFKAPRKRFTSSVIMLMIFALADFFTFKSAAFYEHVYFVRELGAAMLWLTLFGLPQLVLLVVAFHYRPGRDTLGQIENPPSEETGRVAKQ